VFRNLDLIALFWLLFQCTIGMVAAAHRWFQRFATHVDNCPGC